MRPIVIPAEAGGRCALCGRTHRKLTRTFNGLWMGSTCKERFNYISLLVQTTEGERQARSTKIGFGDKVVDKVLELMK